METTIKRIEKANKMLKKSRAMEGKLKRVMRTQAKRELQKAISEIEQGTPRFAFETF